MFCCMKFREVGTPDSEKQQLASIYNKLDVVPRTEASFQSERGCMISDSILFY